MARKKKQSTPITVRGKPAQVDSVQNFMQEWSLRQAEANHVETIEEANDFDIYDEEDEDLFRNYTVYEMHDQAEENLKLLEDAQSDALTPEPGHAASHEEIEQQPTTPSAVEHGGRGSGGTEGVPPVAEA